MCVPYTYYYLYIICSIFEQFWTEHEVFEIDLESIESWNKKFFACLLTIQSF